MMIKIKTILLLVATVATSSLFAQDSVAVHRIVKADFIGDARIDTLLQMHVMQNE